MNIIILGPWKYEDADAALQRYIERTQNYLFYVICSSRKSIGAIWAERNGAPVKWVSEKDVYKADYAFIAYNGEDSAIRRIIMEMKRKGKHGEVIRV